jgi:hypothetical protein
MNVLYCCDWTEYCAGREPQYDGCTYALSDFLLTTEIRRRGMIGSPTTSGAAGGYEYSRPGQPYKVIVSDELAKRVYKAGGIITFEKDPEGLLGIFNPHDPKANIALFRQLQDQTPDQAAHAAEMTGTS